MSIWAGIKSLLKGVNKRSVAPHVDAAATRVGAAGRAVEASVMDGVATVQHGVSIPVNAATEAVQTGVIQPTTRAVRNVKEAVNESAMAKDYVLGKNEAEAYKMQAVREAEVITPEIEKLTPTNNPLLQMSRDAAATPLSATASHDTANAIRSPRAKVASAPNTANDAAHVVAEAAEKTPSRARVAVGNAASSFVSSPSRTTGKWLAAPVVASWKVAKHIVTRPFSWGKRALTSENKMIKYPAVAAGGIAAVGTGAAIMAGSGRNSNQLPPEMLETQAMLNENQQVLDGMMQQQAMMQPMPQQVVAQQVANDPYNQAQTVIGEAAYQGQVAANEPTIAHS